MDKRLSDYIAGGRLSHAVLIEGADFESALSYAREIAKAALCQNGHTACGICRDCQKIEKGIHPDALFFSGDGRAKSFHVKLVREIRRQSYIAPNEAKGRVFILGRADNMTAEAQNALLKIIEDPPRGVTFILTCVNKAALFDTVLSRVSAFSLEDVPGQDPDKPCGELIHQAKSIVGALLGGDELAAMAAFSVYERDRAAFAELLDVVAKEAGGELLSLVGGGKISGGKARRLMKIADAAAELKAGVLSNAGGLIMTAMLPAMLYDD